MIKKSDKRGSHVEVMISFVIFVTFLVFLYSIIQPAMVSKKDKQSMLDFLEMEIAKNVSSELKIITINLTSPISQACINLDEEISNLGIGPNIFVKDDSGQNIESYIPSGDSDDIQIDRLSISDNFFKIYYSDVFAELNSSSSTCTNLARETNYHLGLTKTQNYTSEANILKLIGYYQDYEKLKTDWKISNGTDFGFGFILQNGTVIETASGQEPSTSIFIKESSVQYISLDGNISLGYLKTKIW